MSKKYRSCIIFGIVLNLFELSKPMLRKFEDLTIFDIHLPNHFHTHFQQFANYFDERPNNAIDGHFVMCHCVWDKYFV